MANRKGIPASFQIINQKPEVRNQKIADDCSPLLFRKYPSFYSDCLIDGQGLAAAKSQSEICEIKSKFHLPLALPFALGSNSNIFEACEIEGCCQNIVPPSVSLVWRAY